VSASLIPEWSDRLTAMALCGAWLAGCWLACWACRGSREGRGDR
jgi:hypothetical protein